jgi:hypothetical protein
MRTIVAAAAIALLAFTTTYAVKEALTEQQIEGVQMAIKAMGCTVEDNNIISRLKVPVTRPTTSSARTTASTTFISTKDFKVTKKVKED